MRYAVALPLPSSSPTPVIVKSTSHHFALHSIALQLVYGYETNKNLPWIGNDEDGGFILLID